MKIYIMSAARANGMKNYDIPVGVLSFLMSQHTSVLQITNEVYFLLVEFLPRVNVRPYRDFKNHSLQLDEMHIINLIYCYVVCRIFIILQCGND